MIKKVSVILPTYNEKDNIEELIAQIYHYIQKDLHEVIVVDDNSSDGTQEIIKKLKKNFKNLRHIVRKNKKGLPSAIWRGIIESKGNIVIWMDGDLSHPPKYIPMMLEYIEDYDVICASRYVNQGKDARSFIRVLASKAINLLAYLILGLKAKDLTSGFYVAKKDVFLKVRLMQTGFAEYCIRFTYDAIKNGFKFKEIGYFSPDRKKGVSKTQSNFNIFLKDGYLCVKEIIKLRFRK